MGSSVELTGTPSVEVSKRRELLEILDRVIAYEHYYRAVYGHFTKLLSRVGYSIPQGILEIYEIRVEESAHNRLVVTAVSEIRGRAGDFVSIDQDYKLQANFPAPDPNPEFLKAQAMRHLRVLRELGGSAGFEEKGVFLGYFTYELKRNSQSLPVARAVGVRAPVKGVELEFDGMEPEGGSVTLGQEQSKTQQTGERSKTRDSRDSNETLETAYLAQQIFRGETGRYAKNWQELSRIASFRFAIQSDSSPEGPGVPFAPGSGVIDIENPPSQRQQPHAARELAGSKPEALVIEPMTDSMTEMTGNQPAVPAQ